MLRSNFQNELNELHVILDRMCHLVAQSIDHCVQAFENNDLVLAKEIVENDRKINDIERQIESKCLTLILKEQPIAGDLRDISTALKVVTDLERIGDQSADIAEMILEIGKDNSYKMVEHIPKMAKITRQMVEDAIDAFHRKDLNDANLIKKIDSKVDVLFNQVRDDLIIIIKEQPEFANTVINFLMIAKYFERIGDHAVNICEWVEFNQTGKLNNQKIL